MAERKEGVVLKSIDFSFYVYIPLFSRVLSVHILYLKNETNSPLTKNTSICTVSKTVHVAAAIFVS